MKLKKQKFYIWGLVVTMIAMYGFFPIAPNANAIDAITDAQDLITDSDAGQTADHLFTFTTGTTTESNGYLEVVFPAAFGDVAAADANCPNSDWATTSPNTETIRCTNDSGTDNLAAALSIEVNNVDNPAEGSEGTYTFEISHYDSGDTLLERVQVMVSIHQDILMTATVDSILNFTVSGVTAGSKSVNGVPCDNTSTATTTPFGTLIVNTASSVCQKLNVETNADDGYVVTVEQDQEMTSDAGSNINSFNNSADGMGSTTAQAWASPDNTLDVNRTYGHMGLTSDDDAQTSIQDYFVGAVAQFAGLNGTDPLAIMDHDGPADNVTQNIGEAFVLYRTEIASLQEAGDYENTLTYIVTPTF